MGPLKIHHFFLYPKEDPDPSFSKFFLWPGPIHQFLIKICSLLLEYSKHTQKKNQTKRQTISKQKHKLQLLVEVKILLKDHFLVKIMHDNFLSRN